MCGNSEVVDAQHNESLLSATIESLSLAYVVAKRDRLARDSFLSCWLDKEAVVRGFRIEAADGTGNDDTPTGKLMRQSCVVSAT